MSRAVSLAYAQGLTMEVAETHSREAGTLNNYFLHRGGAGNNLDLILGCRIEEDERLLP
jgi:hypothetical protein